jgi:hypothetical protein
VIGPTALNLFSMVQPTFSVPFPAFSPGAAGFSLASGAVPGLGRGSRRADRPAGRPAGPTVQHDQLRPVGQELKVLNKTGYLI